VILPILTNGSSGRDLAEAVFECRAADVRRMIATDPRLMTTMVSQNSFANISVSEGRYGDLLTFAVASCDIQIVELLLNLGMPANGYQIGSALKLALLADTPSMAQLILSAGASPDPQKFGGSNIMREVIAYSNIGAVMMLLRHRLDVNWIDEMGVGHLQTAVNMNQFEIADLIAAAGANLWQVAGDGAIPAQELVEPTGSERKRDGIAREQLVIRAKKPNLPWPPPKFLEVREKVLAGIWPTTQMYSAGMRVPPQSLAYMRQHFGPRVH
jgi:hypothetical protein